MQDINPNAEVLESRACTMLFTIIRDSATTQRDVRLPAPLQARPRCLSHSRRCADAPLRLLSQRSTSRRRTAW